MIIEDYISMKWSLHELEIPRVRHDWVTSLPLFTFMHWRRKWQLTPVFLPRDEGAWWAAVYGVAQSRTRLNRLSSSSSSEWKCSSKWSFSSIQSLSCVQLFGSPWTAAHQASLSIANSQSLLKLMSIELVMPSNHHPLSSPFPPAFSLSQHQGLFRWVSSSHLVAKVLEFQLQHQSVQ